MGGQVLLQCTVYIRCMDVKYCCIDHGLVGGQYCYSEYGRTIVEFICGGLLLQ